MGEDGLLLVHEPTFGEGEDLDGYLERYRRLAIGPRQLEVRAVPRATRGER